MPEHHWDPGTVAMDLADPDSPSLLLTSLPRDSSRTYPAVGCPWFMLEELLCTSGMTLAGPWLSWVRMLPLPALLSPCFVKVSKIMEVLLCVLLILMLIV